MSARADGRVVAAPRGVLAPRNARTTVLAVFTGVLVTSDVATAERCTA
ncbi:hypothetical protein [Mycolicibacterium sp. P1-5]|nr:hypothetical protein [Mycolicibacterium sp. P1-5]